MKTLSLGATILLFSAGGLLPQATPRSNPASNLGCVSTRQQLDAQVSRLQQDVERDVQALRNLNPVFAVNAKSMEDWLKLAEAEKGRFDQEALDALKDLGLKAAKAALKYAADTKLAIYPINADAALSKYGITNPVIRNYVYKLAQLNVHDPLWFQNVDRSIDGLKAAYDVKQAVTDGKAWTDYASIVIGILPSFFRSTVLNQSMLLKEEGLALSGSRVVLAAVIDNVTRRVSLAKIDALTRLSESQLLELSRLMGLLQQHVQALEQAKTLAGAAACADDYAWQSTLQKQRLNALQAGLVGEYNDLLSQHAAIYRRLGMEPCQSAFFPAGCRVGNAYKADLNRNVKTLTSCLPPVASSAADGLQLETSSSHDVCWTRDSEGYLSASGELPPNKSFKTLLTASPAAAPSSPGSPAGSNPPAGNSPSGASTAQNPGAAPAPPPPAATARQQTKPSPPDSLESLLLEQKKMLAAYEACWNTCPGTVTPENFACEARCRSKLPELDAMQKRIDKLVDKQQ